MGKKLIALSTVITLTMIFSNYGFGQFGNPKKMACEKSCNIAYDQCKETAQKNLNNCKKEAGKNKDESSKKAEGIKCDATGEALKLGCKKNKDECIKKCK